MSKTSSPWRGARLRRAARAATLALLWWAGAAPAQGPPRKILVVPGDVGEQALAQRREAQLAGLERIQAFAFFRFEDRVAESGIRFHHRIVDDAGKHHKMVHYDHGNGVAVADVDGDGHHDIYFLTQLGANELWRNLGNGKFEDATATAGVGLADRVSVAASFGDIDNDGDPDLFVTTVKMGNVLFENDGKGRFRDISQAAGVDYVGHSSGAVFFDYDNDGRLDLFVANVGVYTTERKGRGGYYVGVEGAFSGHLYPERTEASLLYRNLGGNRFEEVSQQTGLRDTGWSGDASAVDLDGDGYRDLYVLNMQGDDHFWVNVEGRAFVDKTSELFPKTPWGTMGVKFFDYDGDGLLDLALTDMHSDMSENVGVEREKLKSRMQWSEDVLQGGDDNIFGNAFYHNRGGGEFVEVSDQIGTENYWPWGLSVDDLNADGFDDMFIASSMNYPFRYGINSLLLNEGGKRFVDAEFILGVEPRRDRAVVQDWFELDCGGEDAGHEYCEGEEGRVTVRGTVGSRGSVIFDLDGDGDLDIVTAEFNGRPQVLVSDLAQQAEIHYLKLRLVGTASNRDGLGARVRVSAGGRVLTKEHDGKSGYLSQSALPLYFGLGAQTRVDRIDVRWPSGREQVVTESLSVNTLLEIVEE
ncbi:MAG TPA: CRTAC1 family protein [Thermoanaerobaculia bacterium]|nr:CRTAC1 family protein [Thermoanaerobaculia bacterium]